MTEQEMAAMSGNLIADNQLFDRLESWVIQHYRDELAPGDLADPALAMESQHALDELTTVLGLGSIYYFQD